MNGPKPGTGEPQAGATGEPQAGDPAAGQAPAATTGQEPAAGAQQGAASGQPTETAEEKAARLERELADARKDAANYRTKAGTLERQQQAAAQAGMSELERAQAAQQAAEERAKQLEAQVRDQGVRAATMAAATRLNFRNPDLAHRLLDASELEFDDAGQPKNAEKLLRELATREPYLVKAAGDYGGGNRGGQPEGQPGMNELLRAALGKG